MNPTEIPSDQLEESTRVVIEKLRVIPIIATMLATLRRDLPANLKYHGQPESSSEEEITHSEDVLHDTILFALADGINDDYSLELLGIMAVYHDAGFLRRYPNNEPIGAQMAELAMKAERKYIDDDIMMVTEGIEATHIDMVGGVLRQRKAPNRLVGYLLDADVSNLGRKDFRNKSDLIFEEVKFQDPDKEIDKTNFLKTTLGFIKNHKWNTKAAQRLRAPQQQINIANLEAELSPVA